MTSPLKLNQLLKKHLNQDCVILTCGPSLNEYKEEIVLDFCKDKIVICVKEAIIKYKNIADYFVANGTRHRKYSFHSKTIKIYQNDGKKKDLQDYNLILNEDTPFNIAKQLLKLKNFDQYNLKNTIKRPWGPGILYETVFYLCEYMGIKNIYTIGWDLIDTTKTRKLTHFFEEDTNDQYKNSQRWKNWDFKKEMVLVNNNIPSMYDYFKKLGVNIFVVGTQSYVNSHIPRIALTPLAVTQSLTPLVEPLRG